MLRLHEQLALLALDEKRGVFTTQNVNLALAGGLFAELLLEQRIAVDSEKQRLVDVIDASPVDHPLLNECLEQMVAAQRRTTAVGWISRWANDCRLPHRIAERLCEQGILRPERVTQLFIFTRRTYPEVNPRPELELRQRLREAIFADAIELDARSAALIALADCVGMLQHVFAREDLKPHQRRLEQIRGGDVAAVATREAIAESEAAVAVACMMPAIMGGMSGGASS
ncbi:MAG: GPP34 family phosphoprotein [Planctomycetaceae bacterium]|nr:GPP34 family phosphoprotein [Planctomycetaceae bacterium]